ncbi:MAG: fumarylacetoacetate hydrolase family protein [Phycisphaerae bacterium]|nr:fumarylacetoacetate hydrolase family protein [Phycisphaerae bacterium]
MGNRRSVLTLVLLILTGTSTGNRYALAAEQKTTRFARFQVGQSIAYGIVEGDRIRKLSGDPFGEWSKTDTTHALSEVKLLVPTTPTKVLALAGNYVSHVGAKAPAKHPEAFFKVPSTLIATGEPIVIPEGTKDVHYEAEMVIVIGKRAKNVPEAKALDYVLGVTCGNDVSARDWQRGDVQWWRAKGSDTFGPCGPFILSGANYDDLRITLRLNGEVKQDQRTRDMIHGVAPTVSWISRHVTLEPGDLIFTGTMGKTSAIKPGDVVEVEIEGVGVLRNPVKAAR